MRLEEFLQSNLTNAYLEEPGFETLYVRKSRRYFFGEPPLYHALDIARVEAEQPGNGAFTKLLERIQKSWNGPVFVECVLTPRFANKLERLGFVRSGGAFLPCFVKLT